jgi:hypothetical protein
MGQQQHRARGLGVEQYDSNSTAQSDSNRPWLRYENYSLVNPSGVRIESGNQTVADHGVNSAIIGTSDYGAALAGIDLNSRSRSKNIISGAPSAGSSSTDGTANVFCNCSVLADVKTVTKEGPNQGKQFYTCSKPM